MFRRILATHLLAAVGALFLTAVQAQTVRYVASNGLNSNDCTREAPCRTLQRGIKKTPDGGEIQILDSGTYGNAVRIDRSITVSAVGVSATVGTIVIEAPDATVVLRGLLLNGTSVPNGPGILISNVAAVHIVACQIERFSGDSNTGHGIRIDAANVKTFIVDTTARDNALDGIVVSSLASGSRLTIAGSHFEANGRDGIRVLASGEATIAGAISSGNHGNGILNQSANMNVTSTTAANNLGSGYVVFLAAGPLAIESSAATGNGLRGLHVNSGSTARISNSVFTSNGTGLENASGTLQSRGNNTVAGNGTNTSGIITALAGI